MDLLKKLKEEQLPEDQRRIAETVGMEAYQKLVTLSVSLDDVCGAGGRLQPL